MQKALQKLFEAELNPVPSRTNSTLQNLSVRSASNMYGHTYRKMFKKSNSGMRIFYTSSQERSHWELFNLEVCTRRHWMRASPIRTKLMRLLRVVWILKTCTMGVEDIHLLFNVFEEVFLPCGGHARAEAIIFIWQ